MQTFGNTDGEAEINVSLSNQTHVVVKRVTRVISMLPNRFLIKSDLNVVRNCFDIRPYKTKSMAAFIKAKRSINSPKGG